VLYWRLGQALNLARSHSSRGEWASFLDDLGIEKTRASRARAIQSAFATEEAVAGLTVEQAYAQRKSKSKPAAAKKRQAQKTTAQELTEQLIAFQEQFDLCAAAVTLNDSAESQPLWRTLAETIKLLTEYQQRLKTYSDEQFLADPLAVEHITSN